MFPDMGELLERWFLPCYRYTEDHAALVASYYIPKKYSAVVLYSVTATGEL
jgi:hypothetical protein